MSQEEPPEPDMSFIFFRLQRFFPHDPRFNHLNFGNQPRWLLIQALEMTYTIEKDELHNSELGISLLTSLFANSNRDPKKTPNPFTAADFWHFKEKGDRTLDIPENACNAFFNLHENHLLPTWTLDIAPIEALRSGRTHKVPPELKAFVGEGMLLLCPSIDEETGCVSAELAILDDCLPGTIELVSLGGSDRIWIEIPELIEAQYSVNAEFSMA